MKLEDAEDGEKQFQLDRVELLDSMILYMNARFQDFVTSPILQSARALEHRRWPTHDRKKLDDFGISELEELASHFKEMKVMAAFNLETALHGTCGLSHIALPRLVAPLNCPC